MKPGWAAVEAATSATRELESLIVVYFAWAAKYYPPEKVSVTTSCARRPVCLMAVQGEQKMERRPD